jgi:hypothetical protein
MPLAQTIQPNVLRFPVERRVEKLPLRFRTALIVSSAAALWAGVLLAGHYVVGALS